MNTKMLALSTLSLSVLLSVLSSCGGGRVTISDVTVCAVAGQLSAGADCVHTISTETNSLTMQETIDFLEPSNGKPGGVFMSAGDFTKIKTALQQLCRAGSCSYEEKKQLAVANNAIMEITGSYERDPLPEQDCDDDEYEEKGCIKK